MAGIQLNADVSVAFKTQAALNTEEPAGAGATSLFYKEGSQGFQPPQAETIQSTTVFGDGMTARPRRGTFNVPGQFQYEAVAGAQDDLYELSFRNSYVAAATIDETTLSSATLSVASSVITFSGGDVITAGVKVGDVIRFTSGLDAADNNRWLRVKAVTTTTITVFETLTDVAGPVASYTFTVPKKLLQGTTSKILTFDQYYAQVGESLVIHDVRGGNLNFALSENSTLDVTHDLMGAGYAYKASGSSPHFSAPTAPSGSSLAFLDGCFVINGSDTVALTGFNLGLTMPVKDVRAANKTGQSPDIIQGKGTPTGQASLYVEDFNLLKAAAAETQIDFMATFIDPFDGGVLHLALTNAILGGESVSGMGTDDEMIQTFDLLAGRDGRGGAYDITGMKLLTSAS